jgi:hypothetical protein
VIDCSSRTRRSQHDRVNDDEPRHLILGDAAPGLHGYPPKTSAIDVLVRPSAALRGRRIAHPTSAAATTVSTRAEIVTASRNSTVCCVLQFDVVMSPVNNAARVVPVTAMPTPELTSVAVSTRAAPIVVRFFGKPRSRPQRPRRPRASQLPRARARSRRRSRRAIRAIARTAQNMRACDTEGTCRGCSGG